jgi:pimeloyl-ACP methyl ester carboxylesterase
MATTAATPHKQRGIVWRLLRWIPPMVLVAIAALLVFAWLRPVELLWEGMKLRLLAEGMHSEFVHLPFSGGSRVRVHYYVGGVGDPVVLVHGLGGRADDWANLMPQLVRDHHRVYALDLPGYGRSAWPRNATYSITNEAAVVEAFADKMHLARFDLGGWSMGGWIAMRVALDKPQRIRRLMIFDSAGTRFALNWDVSLFEPDTAVKLHALNDLLMPTPPPAVPGFVARDIFRFVRLHGWVVRANMDSMLQGTDLLDGKLSALKMPMLIVWGKQDHLIPYTAGEEIHKEVPQSELEIFDGCGHLAPGQCAGTIGPVVLGFLDEKSPMGGREAEIR